MNIESISNGLGAPSLLLVIMAIRNEIPATVAITADTGWENDRLWNTGRRSTNQQYFDEVIVPLCKGSRVTPRFVRSVDRFKNPLLPLGERVKQDAMTGRATHIPLFGSKGGRMLQSCTDKMKIRAIRQELRRMGAKTSRNAQGIHFYEADRRTKGIYIGMDGKWAVYQTTVDGRIRDPLTGEKRKIQKVIKWLNHYYPLVDLGMSREAIYKQVEAEGVPYLISSECDLCPHQDLSRWERKSQEVIDEGERIETLLGGNYFFTPLRIPLRQAIKAMQEKREGSPDADLDFGCGNAICGV